MEIRIDGLAKRYAAQWVFRNLTRTIPSGTYVAITGPNGAGKSTLLKIISGALYPSEGKITYWQGEQQILTDLTFMHIAFAAPYAEMIEEMTLAEAIRFHTRFRTFYPEVREMSSFVRQLQFDFPIDQQIQFMSSGMKQRLRLAFALFTESSMLLLDEPTSNLDAEGHGWFHAVLHRFSYGRTVLIASNLEQDLSNCSDRINLGR